MTRHLYHSDRENNTTCAMTPNPNDGTVDTIERANCTYCLRGVIRDLKEKLESAAAAETLDLQQIEHLHDAAGRTLAERLIARRKYGKANRRSLKAARKVDKADKRHRKAETAFTEALRPCDRQEDEEEEASDAD